MSTTFDIPEPAPPPDRGRLLAWVPWAVIGFLAFELTAEPGLGFAVGCIKFGADDIKNAFWLRRHDPDRPRGRACAWFFLAKACGTIGGTALLALMVVSFVVAATLRRPLPAGAIERQLQVMAVVLILCFGLGALLAWVGIASALRSGTRVWIDVTTTRARRARRWPPLVTGRWNLPMFSARVIALYGLMTAAVAVVFLTAVVFAIVEIPLRALGLPIDNLRPWLAVVGTLIELAILVLVVRLGLRLERFCAHGPWDCYPELRAPW